MRPGLLLPVVLFVAAQAGGASAQAVKTIPCPGGKGLNSCIASHETCGWRNERPTAEELRAEERGAITLLAPCPTLSNGVQLQHCFIDRSYYCKVPSAADIAAAERAKRDREEKARQEKLAAERKQAAIAAETARLGAHREAEARRLVEMREKAEQAKGAKCQGTQPVRTGGHSDPDSMATPTALFPGWSTRDKALASARRSLGPTCRNMTGDAGFTGAKESCTQDSFKKWTCTVDATCTKQVPKCPAGAQ